MNKKNDNILLKLSFSLVLVLLFCMIKPTSASAYDKKAEDVIATAIMNTQTDVDNLKQYNITRSEMPTVFENAKKKNEIAVYTYMQCYMRYQYWTIDSNTGIEYMTKITISYGTSAITNSVFRQRYNECVDKINEITSLADSSWSEFDKALFAHEYLVQNCDYDNTYADTSYSAYGALVEEKAVCEGYSEAYYLILKKLGVSCDFIISDALNHEWNIVKIDGKWYHVDVTWDDPVITSLGSGLSGRVYHNFFLMSDSKIKSYQVNGRSHSSWNTGSTACTSTTYDNWELRNSETMIARDGSTTYYTDPSKNYRLVKKTAAGSKTYLTDTRVVCLDEFYGAILYSLEGDRTIYVYENGDRSILYTCNDTSKYIVGFKMGAGCVNVILRQYNTGTYSFDEHYLFASVGATLSYDDAVSGMTVTNNYQKSIAFKWNALSSADGYKVYYLEPSTGKYKLFTNTTGNSVTVTGLLPATTYTFVVQPFNKKYGYELVSTQKTSLTTTTLPSATSSITCSSYTDKTLTLNCTAVARATGYRLVLTNMVNSKVVKTVYVTKAYTFTELAIGTKYKVVATPYVKYNNKTYYCNTSTTCYVATKSSKTTITYGSCATNKITVSLSKPQSSINGYVVYYRKAGATGNTYSTSVTGTTASVTGLTAATDYYIVVKPYISVTNTVNGVSKVTKYYGEANELLACTSPYQPNYTISTGSGKVTISVSPVTNASGYVIFYKLSGTSSYTKLTEISTAKSFTTTALAKNKSYDIMVRSIRRCNGKIAWSLFTAKTITVK